MLDAAFARAEPETLLERLIYGRKFRMRLTTASWPPFVDEIASPTRCISASREDAALPARQRGSADL